MDQGAPELCIPRFPSIGEAAHSPDERLDATAGYGGPFRNRAVYIALLLKPLHLRMSSLPSSGRNEKVDVRKGGVAGQV